MNGFITYARTGPMPRCRVCGYRMDYWVPGLPDKEHEHTECAAQRMASEAFADLRLEPPRRGGWE